MITHIADAAGRVLLAACVVGAADAVILLTAEDMFFTAPEQYSAMAYAWIIVTGVGGLSGILGSAVVIGIGRHIASARHRMIVASAVLGAAGFWLLRLLTSGARVADIPGRIPLVAAIALLLSTGSIIALKRLMSFANRGGVHRASAAMLFFLFGTACMWIDATVLVRLYTPFHVALSVMATGFFAAAFFTVPLPSPHRCITALIIILISLSTTVVGGMAAWRISDIPNHQFVLSSRTITAAHILSAIEAGTPDVEDTESDIIEMATQSDIAISDMSRPNANILLITVDAMRHDRLTPGQEGVMPFTNRLAASSAVFTYTYSPYPRTSYSITSLLTGKYIEPILRLPGQEQRQHDTWPEILRRFRYRTGGFFTRSVFFVDRHRFKAFENRAFGFGYRKMEYSFTAPQKTDQALAFLQKMNSHPSSVFTWVHYFDAHEPYDANCTKFGTTNMARYDCELWRIDKEINRLVTYVETHFPNTIIILTADHGEEFGEHGGQFHGTTLYDEQARVPLLIRIPDQPHRMIDQPVTLVDILGTVLFIVDIPIPPRVRSRNLAGLIAGRDNAPTVAFAALDKRKMAVHDFHKLIWNQGNHTLALFDLIADPAETRSVVAQKPQVVNTMKAMIRGFDRSHGEMELRPVSSSSGRVGWPESVRRVMGGDHRDMERLFQYLTPDTPALIRRKVAQLLHDNWTPLLDEAMPDRDVDFDATVKTWILLARHPDPTSQIAQQLHRLQPDLTPFEQPWLQSVLYQTKGAPQVSWRDCARIIDTPSAPMHHRKSAIQVLGEKHITRAAPHLIAALDDWGLRLSAARALAALHHVPAVEHLSAIIWTERMVSRRKEIVDAITALAKDDADDIIAVEMTRHPPIGDELLRLDALDSPGSPTRYKTATAPEGTHPRVTWGHCPSVFADAITTVPQWIYVLFDAPLEPHDIHIHCNGIHITTLATPSAATQYRIALSDCPTTQQPPTVEFVAVPDTNGDVQEGNDLPNEFPLPSTCAVVY